MILSPHRFCGFALIFLCAAGLHAQQGSATHEVLQIPEPGRLKVFFQPFRTDNAAISPDGKYLAYSFRDGPAVFLRIVEIDHPEKIITQAPVIDDEGATPMISIRQSEKTPGRITWLGWVSPNRVVVETNRVLARSGASGEWYGWRGSVVAFNADGGKPKILASPDDTDEYSEDRGPSGSSPARPRPLGGPDRPVDAYAPALPVPDERIGALKTTGINRVRSMRILGHDPDRAGSLIVMVTSPDRVATYSLNGQNGKLKALSTEPIGAAEDVLIDQQGRPRLTVANNLLAGFPLMYEYRGAKGTSRGEPLDQAAGVAGFTLSPENFFAERSIPLGFDYNPNLLYYAAPNGQKTYGLYSLDLAAKQRGKLAMANPDFDLIGLPDSGFPERGVLIMDRFQRQLAGVRFEGSVSTTAWVKPEWQQMQAGFENSFPGVSVKIVDWDQEGHRLVVMTEGPTDPGAVLIYDAGKKQLLEFLRRAPWTEASHTHRSLPFACAAADGTPISGVITVPRQPRLKPVPMVVFCPDLPWQRVGSDFQAEVQALAEMGFVVVRLNGRGAWGFGAQQLQPLRTGYDLVQIEDILTSVAHLGKVFPVNPDRVALLGRGHGGFIALRALQDHPGKFRGAIALDAPVNLRDWFASQQWDSGSVQPALTLSWFGNAARLQADPLARHPEAVTKPILMLNYPGPHVGPNTLSFASARQFADRVRGHGTPVEFAELTKDYMNGLPQARAAVFDRIEEFLNLHIYDFNVKLHELQVK